MFAACGVALTMRSAIHPDGTTEGTVRSMLVACGVALTMRSAIHPDGTTEGTVRSMLAEWDIGSDHAFCHTTDDVTGTVRSMLAEWDIGGSDEARRAMCGARLCTIDYVVVLGLAP
jgi:hypothetical protein